MLELLANLNQYNMSSKTRYNGFMNIFVVQTKTLYEESLKKIEVK